MYDPNEPQLRDLARELRDKEYTPRVAADGNIPQIAKLMVMVAKDVACVNYTGRTYAVIEADAVLVLDAMMMGVIRI